MCIFSVSAVKGVMSSVLKRDIGEVNIKNMCFETSYLLSTHDVSDDKDFRLLHSEEFTSSLYKSFFQRHSSSLFIKKYFTYTVLNKFITSPVTQIRKTTQHREVLLL